MKKAALMLLAIALIASVLAACSGSSNNGVSNSDSNSSTTNNGNTGNPRDKVTLSLLVDNNPDSIATAEKLVEEFQKKYDYITVETDIRPGGSEGDNIVKTRLATGDMTDVFFYNSGSLLQALNPDTNLLDLTNEPFMSNVMDSFKSTVTQNGKVFGVPTGSSMAGGWLYNKKVYEQHNLQVPKTWEELMSNLKALEGTDVAPIIGSYKDTWTSQLLVLADYYNVQLADPSFADDYTHNKAKYASNPAALRSFEKLEETVGLMNKDYLATTYDAGLRKLAEGEGAHYPMLSFAISAMQQNMPEAIEDIGFFAQPGESADTHGLTVWMPGGAYIYKNSPRIEEAKLFLEFIASVDGVKAMSEVAAPIGPYLIVGADMPDSVPQVVKDILPYFENGNNAAALEFVSPVKGPSLEQITVEVGSGQKTALEGAELYDRDVEKQAQQLGLEGW
ncbi:hypothetical protein J40TS1_38550 [Paenibacillus montaniterrae]|uniref:ABC transporter substrate-binding protein n=1 Tax=Paenibacillus montaniterrae TaxID=429341 RepID=A0A919YWS8_9BACL|nr:extracellular solute-binding protein [Paenibacillus montaniterrae]GIP18213.1 hypothetical protein J40TS1_38550 [Paenibacillus montaniterrae]